MNNSNCLNQCLLNRSVTSSTSVSCILYYYFLLPKTFLLRLSMQPVLCVFVNLCLCPPMNLSLSLYYAKLGTCFFEIFFAASPFIFEFPLKNIVQIPLYHRIFLIKDRDTLN
uniref:Uncharacterized protein n=1 Tax=Cacopsylla melanoneura TaxID=428564 RepID=A0A8D8YDZ5_9HEMI